MTRHWGGGGKEYHDTSSSGMHCSRSLGREFETDRLLSRMTDEDAVKRTDAHPGQQLR